MRTTILLVDGDGAFRDLLSELLCDEGCYVACAGSARRALEMLESLRPDLVIVNLAMPVMNGSQFVRALESDERFEDIPVAVLSALPNQAPVASTSSVILPDKLLGLLNAVAEVRSDMLGQYS